MTVTQSLLAINSFTSPTPTRQILIPALITTFSSLVSPFYVESRKSLFSLSRQCHTVGCGTLNGNYCDTRDEIHCTNFDGSIEVSSAVAQVSGCRSACASACCAKYE